MYWGVPSDMPVSVSLSPAASRTASAMPKSVTLRRTSSPVAALLRYNGCVKGTNTPDCGQYPGRVLARASRVRQEILAAYPPPTPAAPGALPAPVQLARR
jgi:hypothetical protein